MRVWLWVPHAKIPPMQPTASSLAPLLTFCAGLDLSDPAAARASLEQQFPFSGDAIQELRASMVAALEAGEICQNGEDPLRYSRVFKQSDETLQFSADAVLMNGAGPKHRHPEGEIDLCFALDGDPRFDGNPEGWVVYGPGSVHIPTVQGGSMLILYLLPSGAFEFVKD